MGNQKNKNNKRDSTHLQKIEQPKEDQIRQADRLQHSADKNQE